MKIYKINSPAETKKLAGLLAKKSLRTKRKNALVFALAGELGTGKTTFIQGFLRGLGIKRRITSPTFVIVKNYELRIKNDGKYKNAYHIDCYRIKKSNEILKLNFKNILADPQNIILIEWAEKIKKILPRESIWIKFEHGKKNNQRLIKYCPNS